MTGKLLSPAATGLLRALVQRVSRDRILLSAWQSDDWQSLTFVGERHHAELRITGADSAAVAARLMEGIGEAELTITGQIVADITPTAASRTGSDGSTLVNFEALTVAE